MFERGLTGANDLPQNGRGQSVEPIEQRCVRDTGLRRWWLNGLLFALTLVTTTMFGAALVTSFEAGRAFDPDCSGEAICDFCTATEIFGWACAFQGPCCYFADA